MVCLTLTGKGKQYGDIYVFMMESAFVVDTVVMYPLMLL